MITENDKLESIDGKLYVNGIELRGTESVKVYPPHEIEMLELRKHIVYVAARHNALELRVSKYFVAVFIYMVCVTTMLMLFIFKRT
jgi:hypothetical protein